jgi:hypothetical protein
MTSSLKNYTDDIRIEDTAYHVINCFEEVLGRKLYKDEQEYTMGVTKKTFNSYVVESVGDILVVGDDEKKKLDDLLEKMVNSISALIVNYIYSRLETYILYKTLKKDRQ